MQVWTIIHIWQGNFYGIVLVIRLPRWQGNNQTDIGKIDLHQTTAKRLV